MAVKDIKNKLATTLANNKSNWQTKAEWRQANESWLRHSRQIALKIKTPNSSATPWSTADSTTQPP